MKHKINIYTINMEKKVVPERSEEAEHSRKRCGDKWIRV